MTQKFNIAKRVLYGFSQHCSMHNIFCLLFPRDFVLLMYYLHFLVLFTFPDNNRIIYFMYYLMDWKRYILYYSSPNFLNVSLNKIYWLKSWITQHSAFIIPGLEVPVIYNSVSSACTLPGIGWLNSQSAGGNRQSITV